MPFGHSTGSNFYSIHQHGPGLFPGLFVEAPDGAIIFVGDWIEAVVPPGMATGDAGDGQKAAALHAVFFNGLPRIVGTGREIAA